MSDNVIYVAPVNVNDTKVRWAVGSVFYEIDSNINFVRAMVFLDRKLVLVFHSRPSDQSSYVGKAFDYQGNILFDIPFPDLGCGDRHVRISYGWSSEIPQGVKIVFGSNLVSYGDFWCDFDFDRRKYVASGEAR